MNNPTPCSFFALVFPCNIDFCLNPSIGNCILYDLVSIAVKDQKYVSLLVVHFGQAKM
jgi:hypothetical protein